MNHQIKTIHLNNLTDKFGVWQHHENGKVHVGEGYALDDSARALIVFLLYGQKEQAEICLSYLEKSVKDQKMIGFFWADKTVRTFPSSEDAFALAYWALAYCIKNNFQKERAQKVVEQLDINVLRKSQHIRTRAYTLIADSLVGNSTDAEKTASSIIQNFDPQKEWFEPKLFYANAIIPYALLTYAQEFSKTAHLNQIIEQSIITLERYCRIGKIPAPVGNRIWQAIGEPYRDPYGQQPIDAAYMVMLLVKAYEAYKNPAYKESAQEWMDWFYGNNIMKANLITDEGACADGIDEFAVSSNYGAESTIVYLWAAHEIKNI
jgi:hypothetical protein